MTTSYNARAETTLDLNETSAEQLLDRLDGYHPAVGRSFFGRTEAVITLPAETLRQAISTATAVLDTAVAGLGDVVSLEVLTTADFDRRVGLDPVPELVSVTEAAAELGVTRQAVLQRIDSGSLPASRIGTTWGIPRSSIEQVTREHRRAKRIDVIMARDVGVDMIEVKTRQPRKKKSQA